MQHRFPAEKCGERCCTWRPSPAHMSLQAAHTCCKMTIALLPRCYPLALQQYGANCFFVRCNFRNHGRALTGRPCATSRREKKKTQWSTYANLSRSSSCFWSFCIFTDKHDSERQRANPNQWPKERIITAFLCSIITRRAKREHKQEKHKFTGVKRYDRLATESFFLSAYSTCHRSVVMAGDIQTSHEKQNISAATSYRNTQKQLEITS